ncbi:hypothetical protein FOA52_003488 [Chlamydomonas sp. UWO 241]|nr:hypothetical protein FOA52_003488 [Chlamydomonas sp. UWO 241]
MAVSTICLVACLLLLGSANAERKLQGVYEPQYPLGHWNSIGVAGSPVGMTTWCGLRDFPPIPDGYGAARMLCGGVTRVYDPYWMWKLTKVPSTLYPEPLASNASDIETGEPVNLRIFNPMLTFCERRSNGQLWCGVEFSKASVFTAEVVGKPGNIGVVIDFAVDQIYLRSGSGLNNYCRVKGSSNGAYVYCNAPATLAMPFSMPYSHKAPVTLTNVLTSKRCGANFIPLQGVSSEVNCTGDDTTWKNFYTGLVIAAELPGGPVLIANASYAVLSYDNLYHYQVAAWDAGANGTVDSISNDTEQRSLYFHFERAGAKAGEALVSGDVIAIKSKRNGKYCGVKTETGVLTCDMLASPTNTSGYLFLLTL